MEVKHNHYVIAIAKGAQEPAEEYVKRCQDIVAYANERTQQGWVLFPDDVDSNNLHRMWEDVFNPFLRSISVLASQGGYGIDIKCTVTDGLDVEKYAYTYPSGLK